MRSEAGGENPAEQEKKCHSDHHTYIRVEIYKDQIYMNVNDKNYVIKRRFSAYVVHICEATHILMPWC